MLPPLRIYHALLRNTRRNVFQCITTVTFTSFPVTATCRFPPSLPCRRSSASFYRTPAANCLSAEQCLYRTQQFSLFSQNQFQMRCILRLHSSLVTKEKWFGRGITSLHRQQNCQIFQPIVRTMANSSNPVKKAVQLLPEDEEMRQQLREIFLTAVDSVMPKSMLDKVIHYNSALSTLTVEQRNYSVQHNVFVVGFGKAVLGMARVVEDLLGNHIVKGILSIPAGARADYEKAGKVGMLLSKNSKIQVQEGATNNLPDQNAFRAAKDIHELISSLSRNDIVIVLMSGGGSALLPYPMEPLDMDDILLTTRELFSHGATIGDVNTVRMHLEVLKGGGLARAAFPAQVISLIISDVIGDSLELIASGPTVRHTYCPHRCLDVINRLSARDSMPAKVLQLLESSKSRLVLQSQFTPDPRGGVTESALSDKTDWSRVHNVLVGSNAIGCAAAAQCAEQKGFISIILSHELSGDARKVGALLAKLGQYISALYHPRIATTANSDLIMLELEITSYGISKDKLNEIASKAKRAYNSSKAMCIVAGGETVVTITGKGKGGRCQEMALAAGIQLQKGFQVFVERRPTAKVFFLSAGTDGQDGPTGAAGALVDENFMLDAEAQGLDPQKYLDNSDSYGLWSQFANGRDLLVTGLTGTNVMDIQLLVVKN